MKDCLRFCFCIRTLAATLCLTLWSGASIAQEAAYLLFNDLAKEVLR